METNKGTMERHCSPSELGRGLALPLPISTSPRAGRRRSPSARAPGGAPRPHQFFLQLSPSSGGSGTGSTLFFSLVSQVSSLARVAFLSSSYFILAFFIFLIPPTVCSPSQAKEDLDLFRRVVRSSTMSPVLLILDTFLSSLLDSSPVAAPRVAGRGSISGQVAGGDPTCPSC